MMEKVKQMAVNMLINAGYKVDISDDNAILEALSDYEEKHNAMLEHLLMQKTD